ncbi:MAG: hypothetical protein AAGD35_19285 [Actinomycetota bacterium]
MITDVAPAWLPDPAPDERPLWHGHPNDRPVIWRRGDWRQLAVTAVVCTVFTVFAWFLRRRGASFDALLVGVAALLTLGRWTVGLRLRNWLRRRRTRYALTTRRAVIRTGLLRSTMMTTAIDAATTIGVTGGPGGMGTIFFSDTDHDGYGRRGGHNPEFRGLHGFQFFEIPDVHTVAALIRGRQEAAASGEPPTGGSTPSPGPFPSPGPPVEDTVGHGDDAPT